MEPAQTGLRRRVWIGGVFALVAVGGWMFWTVSISPPVPAAGGKPAPFVRLAGAGVATSDQVLREKSELLDPTPLFFPTEWNYGQRPPPTSSLRQPGEEFASFPPQLPVSERTGGRYASEPAAVPETLSDVLTQGDEAPFAGMGQVDRQRSTLPVRGGYVEVKEIVSGEIVISQSLVGISAPSSDAAPVEFLVVVSSAGIVGEPFITKSSANEEVDEFYRDYLVRSYRLGERLRPGRYRVWVGA